MSVISYLKNLPLLMRGRQLLLVLQVVVVVSGLFLPLKVIPNVVLVMMNLAYKWWDSTYSTRMYSS